MRVWIKVSGFIEVETVGRENLNDYLDRVTADDNEFDVSEIKGFQVQDVEHAFSDKYAGCVRCGTWRLSSAPSQEAWVTGMCNDCSEEEYQRKQRAEMARYR